MSLLLDALKKAAEQKAEKEGESGAEEAVAAESSLHDETQTLAALETDLSLDPTEVGSSATELAQNTSINIDSEAVTDLGEETIMKIFDEDQTMVLTDDDVTSFLGDHGPQVDRTEAIPPDEDLSLLLVDEEGRTELPDAPETESLAASTEVQILADEQGTTNHLNLDNVPIQVDPDDPDRTVIVRADTALTGGRSPEEFTNTEGLGLKEQTSTRTYAPDNYDRTLVKMPDDDASGLFAGMKSDSGDVMTPEHAKQLFVSKSSAQRSYYNRVYGAVAFGILLVIFIFGLFELQEKSLDIDTSLRTLKRDPMPGTIKIASEEEATNLFTETNQVVDTLTLQLVEAAEIIGDTEIYVEQVTEVEQSPEPLIAETESSESEAVQSGEQVSQTAITLAQPGNQANNDAAIPKDDEATKQQLQIITRNTISDKDQWLQQAYTAYQRGDDETALEKYTQVLEVDTGNRNALLARAAIYIQSSNVKAAIRDYQTLLLANPKDSLAMASLMSVANYSPQVAESQLKIMIRDEPYSPYLNFALANVYGAQNRWVEAQGLYFTALENNPNDPNYAYNLAVSLEHIEKPDVAIAYYERALDNINNGLATFNRDLVGQRLQKLKKL